MTPTPFILKAWLALTRVFAGPVAWFSAYFHRKMGADSARFPERLGKDLPDKREKVIWFHAASLGEVRQIGPLAEHLHEVSGTGILVTTATAAGADWVAQNMPYATHRYAPLDTPSSVKAFLTGWSFTVAVFVEGDLWPRMLLELEKHDIPRVLLNARHSRTRLRFSKAFARLLGSFAFVTCRGQGVADDMLALGLQEDQVHVLPDLRTSLPKLSVDADFQGMLAAALGDRPRWLAASTHMADEEAVLDAHAEVLVSGPDTILILAPRHPRRGDELARMANERGFQVARRSLREEITSETCVYIVDTLGEMGTMFSLCPLAFMGGSIGKEGGHTPYEPASFGTAILYCPHVKNFADAYSALKQAGAAVEVREPDQLGAAVTDLMQNARAGKMGQAGLQFTQDARGGFAQYVELLSGVITPGD